MTKHQCKLCNIFVYVSGILIYLMFTSAVIAKDCSNSEAIKHLSFKVSLDGVAISDSSARERIDYVRADIQSFLRQAGVTSYDITANARPQQMLACVKHVSLRISKIAPSGRAFGSQGFSIKFGPQTVAISARTSMGLIYGSYELLEKFGFRWISPDVTVVPKSIYWQGNSANTEIIAPIISYRGFLTYSENVDPRFVKWSVRNKFNFLGASEKNNELMSLLGVSRAAGGHDVFSRLIPSSKIENGKTLVSLNPYWYGNSSSPDPIPLNAVNYQNPCFADPEFLDYFVSALDFEIDNGVYKNSDLVNIWPSDSPRLSLSPSCKHPADVYTDVGQLMHFYREVITKLSLNRVGKRPVTISGIGYYDTMNLRTSGRYWPQGSNGVSFTFQFYPIERSFSESGLLGQSEINRKIMQVVDGSVSHFGGEGEFGIVDYLNLSSYLGLVSFNAEEIVNEISGFASRGFSYYSYMHPLSGGSTSEALAKYVISRSSFFGEDVGFIKHNLLESVFEGDKSLLLVLQKQALALSNKTEVFGVGSSLDLTLRAPLIWKGNKFFSRSEGLEIAKKIIDGTPVTLAPLRLGALAPVNFNGIGVSRSISLLDDSIEIANSSLSRHSGNSLVILKDLIAELKRARGLYENQRLLVLYTIHSINGNNEGISKVGSDFARNQIEVLNLAWPDPVSGFSQKKLFEKNNSDILLKLAAEYGK